MGPLSESISVGKCTIPYDNRVIPPVICSRNVFAAGMFVLSRQWDDV